MPKSILSSDAARQKLMDGVSKLAGAVKITMGPKGRNVVLKSLGRLPVITNDGVTIAKEIDLKDPFENLGAELVKEAASKTNDAAGDGTTTATVLAESILSEGLKLVAAGANPMAMRLGIKKATTKAIEVLQAMAKKTSSKEEIAQVAAISSSDEEIGETIADVMKKVGHDGVVAVEEGNSLGLEVDHSEGMQFTGGYLSPYMVTDPGKMEAVLENSFVLITELTIDNIQQLTPILEQIQGTPTKKLLIIAPAIEGEAMGILILNKIKGVFQSVAITAPSFGDRRKSVLQDLCVVTGANLVSPDMGTTLEEITLNDLGRVKKVVVTKDTTTIIGGVATKKDINERIKTIKTELNLAKGGYEQTFLKERIAKLSGGVAVLKVGAATETEAREKKHRVEDALWAAQAAISEGILAGGGVALLRTALKLEAEAEDLREGEKEGYDLLVKSLYSPIMQIAENAGINGDVAVTQVSKAKDTEGFDASVIKPGAKDVEIVDMFKAGIVDPLKVTRSALENAASISSIFLTTEVAVNEDEPDLRQVQENN